ncbi:MAG: nitrogen regulation protein NR(I) [Gammaproteobacteria bacterium]|nr:MAG: nitrogen regulation protein NR(I) [Gammaproteobacteria bacterium]
MSPQEQVWIVDDDASLRWVLERALGQAGFTTRTFDNAEALLQALRREVPDAVVTDVRMPGMDGLELMERVKGLHPELPVVVMTAFADLDRAVAAFRGGAFEYLAKPFDIDEAVALVRRAVSHRPAVSAETGEEVPQVSGIVGAAPAMQELFRAIGRLSNSGINVLITGESGTGKELVASALHQHSPRSEGPFIAINTAAIPRELLESELFGHERGAFTGATSRRIGRFEQAHGGTLFLDEIGDMSPELQTRLLRVLATGEFYRVGGHEPVAVDVRVIAATHQDLERRVAEGGFREDLFHRLNVIRLQIPPLRERREDIPLLCAHFLSHAAAELGVKRKELSAEALQRMEAFSWPGNVRQLQNVCRWVTVMAPSEVVLAEDLPPELEQEDDGAEPAGGWEQALARWLELQAAAGTRELATPVIAQVERLLIEAALRRTGGHRQEAARLLGWGRNTLTRKIRELGLDQPG